MNLGFLSDDEFMGDDDSEDEAVEFTEQMMQQFEVGQGRRMNG